jgi:hypothetical protein
MKPIKRLRVCIEKVLGDEYFLVTNPSYPIYEKRFHSGRVVWVSLEKPSDRDELCIELKEFEGDNFNPNHPINSIWLNDFKKLKGYFFSIDRPIEDALNLIKEHMSAYGIPWLNGEHIVTPELENANKQHQMNLFERKKKEAREKFKLREYVDCLSLYEEIEKIAKLDELDEKYKLIAQKKQA